MMRSYLTLVSRYDYDVSATVQTCPLQLTKSIPPDRNLKKYDEAFGPDFKGSDGKALTVMATFDYEAQNMDELTFTKGNQYFDTHLHTAHHTYTA